MHPKSMDLHSRAYKPRSFFGRLYYSISREGKLRLVHSVLGCLGIGALMCFVREPMLLPSPFSPTTSLPRIPMDGQCVTIFVQRRLGLPSWALWFRVINGQNDQNEVVSGCVRKSQPTYIWGSPGTILLTHGLEKHLWDGSCNPWPSHIYFAHP